MRAAMHAAAKRAMGRFGTDSRAFQSFGLLRPLQKGADVVRLFPSLRTQAPTAEPGGLPAVLGRLGSLEGRLATSPKEGRQAQRLRFKGFYDEMSAGPHRAPPFSPPRLPQDDAN